jgi:hypothetical protein
MKRTGNIFTFIVLIAVVAGAARYFYSGFQLRQYGNTTTGIIDQVNTGEHKRRELSYHFSVGGKEYKGKTIPRDSIHHKPGDTIRVKYSSKNPDLNQIDE